MKVNWTNRRKILTLKELRHLHLVAGCKTKAKFQHTIDWQDECHKINPEGTEPCRDCRQIAVKLGMRPTGSPGEEV